MLLLRRYLAIAALLFWQGGFVFYASVVVPTGQEVLRSHLRQGRITRKVTVWLNISGGIALVPLAWDQLARDPARWRRRSRLALWLVMALTLAGLFWLHPQLDRLLAGEGYDPEPFRPLHRIYLWTQTVQWFAAIVYLGLTLAAWRAEDRQQPAGSPEPQTLATS
jgi:hypothetical protein